MQLQLGPEGGRSAASSGVASAVAAGFVTLMVAMGIGRFLYTPLLPLMLKEYGLRTDQAGLLASLNYVGYLVGAFSAGPLCHRLREYRVLAAGLVLSCLSTAATGLFTDFAAVSVARLVGGAASAFAFVAVSGLVLTVVARHGRDNLAGLYYGGVGGGIVFTGLSAATVAGALRASGAWIVFGIVSMALTGVVLLVLRRHDQRREAAARAAATPLPWSPGFVRLTLAYGLEGFGYIITGTFMVAAANATVGPAGARLAWVVAGCSALPSAFVWSTVARRWGRLKLLVGAFFLQAVGVALPALLPGAVAVVAGAVLFGATFMGIVTLALSHGASFAPTARSRILALMTGFYGIGQIVGPALAGYFVQRTGSYQFALIVAAASVVLAGLLILPDAFTRAPQPAPVPPEPDVSAEVGCEALTD